MGAYEALSGVYDRLNGDVDYKKWADFIEECYARYLKEKHQLVIHNQKKRCYFCFVCLFSQVRQ